VAVSYWLVPVRLDRRCGMLDLLRSGWIRFTRTPSLSESFGDVGSRSEGQGGEGRESSPR
jgi:hypothetical protein